MLAGGPGSPVREVPYMGVADFLGINRREAAAHMALSMWALTHPNAAADPQVRWGMCPMCLMILWIDKLIRPKCSQSAL